MKKNKGFTLVELIGVMIVLAIISMLVIPPIIKVIKESKDNLYTEQVNLVLDAAKNYGVEHFEELDEVNITFLTIKQLIDSGFIETDKSIDPRTNEEMTGCVMVSYDYSNKKYKYEYLEECNKNKYANKLTVTSNYTGNWQAEVKVSIETTYLGTDDSTTYRYCISSSKCNPNIGVDAASGTVDVDIESETAYVCAISVTASGAESKTECVGPFKVDKTAPVLTIPGDEELDSLITTYDMNAGVSAVDNVTPAGQISITRTGNISLGTLGTYTLTYTAKDKAGNVAVKKRTVKVVDVTPPEIKLAISGNPYNSYGWATDGVNISISATDLGGSGVAGYWYCITDQTTCTPNQWVNGKSTDTLKITTEGSNVMVCVMAKDGSSNKSTRACLPQGQAMKIDVTDPECSLTTSGTTANGWYTTNAVVTFASKSSDVTAYNVTDSSTASYGTNDTYTQSQDTDGKTIYGYVRDKAGRTGKCSTSVKRDTVAPSCTLKIDTAASQGNWRNGNTTVSFNSKSSDVTSYNVTTGGASYDGNNSTTITWNTNGGYVYGYVKDRANHTGSCSTQVYVDMSTPNTPSASVSGKTVTANSAGTNGASGICWYSLNDGGWQTSNQWSNLGNGTYYVKTISCSGVVSAASNSVTISPTASVNTTTAPCGWASGSCKDWMKITVEGTSVTGSSGSDVYVDITVKIAPKYAWLHNSSDNSYSRYVCIARNHEKNTNSSYCVSSGAQIRDKGTSNSSTWWNSGESLTSETYTYTKNVTISNPSGCYDIMVYGPSNNAHISGNISNGICFN